MGSVSFREGNASGLLRSQGALAVRFRSLKNHLRLGSFLGKTSSRPDIMENRTQV